MNNNNNNNNNNPICKAPERQKTSVAMQTKGIAVYVANSTRLPYLHVSATCISVDSTPDGCFYSRSASTSVTTCIIGSVINPHLQSVLPCLSVTLFNIISLLIYPAAFVSSMLYHVLKTRVILISSENMISRNRMRAHISTVSRRLQNSLQICIRHLHFYLHVSHIHSLPYICVTNLSNCDFWLQTKPNLDVCLTLDAS